MFLRVFDGSSSQESVFEKTLTDTVSAVMTGFNACILCYGQTGCIGYSIPVGTPCSYYMYACMYGIGSGKTYTFFGPDEELGADELFTLSENNKSGQGVVQHLSFSLYTSTLCSTYIHIYCIKIMGPYMCDVFFNSCVSGRVSAQVHRIGGPQLCGATSSEGVYGCEGLPSVSLGQVHRDIRRTSTYFLCLYV